MRMFQTSLALIALFALMLPSVCVAEHHHLEVDHTDACSAEHSCCQACHEEPCSPSPKVLLAGVSSSLEIPVRQIQLITIFKTTRPLFVAAPRPSGELLLLQTVQLLI